VELDLIASLCEMAVTHCSTGYPFINERRVFFIPPGEPYSEVEKMLSPFEFEVWIAITTTLLIALLTVQIINRCSLYVKNIVFGQDNNRPSLNIAETVLCGTIARTPKKNFARFILMLFIIWSLIIRTCYQSLLYKNLQADLRKATVQSFAELVEGNFTFFVLDHQEINWINQLSEEEGLPR